MLAKNMEQLETIRNECKSLVSTRASLSAGAAVIPIPGADVGIDVGILLEMIPTINRKFGLTPDQIGELNPEIKKYIFIAITSVGGEMVGKLITKQLVLQVLKRVGIRIATKSVVKFIPFLGQAVAASISFGAMKLVGNSHVDDCYEVAKRAILSAHESNV